VSDVFKDIAGAVLVIVGAVIYNPGLIKVGIGLLISGIADALQPKPRLPGNPGIQQEYSGTVNPRIIIYGQMKVSGMQLIEPLTSGTNNQYLHQGLVLANKPCHAITDVYFDQTVIASADIGSVSGTSADGLVGGATAYAGKAWIRRYTGSQTTVDFILHAAFPTQWPSTSIGYDQAYLAIQYLYDTDAYRNGKPQVTAIVQGAVIYDPRLDTSPGANPTNPTYAAYSTNPALCLADYIVDQDLGLAESTANVNWPLVVAAANICDEAVSIPGSTTQPRYTCNVVIDCTARYEDNIAVLAGAMMGQCFWTGSKWNMYAGAWSSAEFALDETDLTGPVTMTSDIPRVDKYNFVRGTFMDPTMNYQQAEFQPRGDSSYESDDGERIQKQVQFAACTDQYEAQRNAIILLKQSRNRRSAMKMCGMSAYRMRPWMTGTDTLSALGWNAQSVRCIAWKFTPNGQINVGLREETSAQWDDPIVADYEAPGSPLILTPGLYKPDVVANLTAFAATDGFILRWDNPSNYIGGMTFDVYEYTSSTPFASATLIRNTAQSSIFIEKSDSTTRYYWIVARIGSTQGSNFPSADGLAAHANGINTTFRAPVSPGVALYNNSASSGNTNNVTVSPVNGTPGYTYAWVRLSGDSTATISSSTSATVHWSRTGMVLGNTYSAVWQCTVTDSASATATCTVNVQFVCETPGL